MAKSPDRWAVGDEVEVADRKETQYGVKLKLRKPGFEPGNYQSNASSASGDEGRGSIIGAQWAVNAAIEYIRVSGQQNATLESVEATAKLLIETRDKVKEHGESK